MSDDRAKSVTGEQSSIWRWLHTIRSRRGALKKAGWGFGDQVLSSVTNFALLVIVARNESPADVGVFVLYIAGYQALTYANESITAEPLVVRYTGAPDAQWRLGVAAATGSTLFFAVACSLVLLALEAHVSGHRPRPVGSRSSLRSGALSSRTRCASPFFAQRQPRRAFINDAVWAVLQLGGVLTILALSFRTVGAIVLTWAAAGATAGAIALAQARVLPRPFRTRHWLHEQRDLWRFILS